MNAQAIGKRLTLSAWRQSGQRDIEGRTECGPGETVVLTLAQTVSHVGFLVGAQSTAIGSVQYLWPRHTHGYMWVCTHVHAFTK